MNPSPNQKRPLLDLASVLVRWLLGGLFIYMGLSKALHPELFLKLVRQYHIVTTPLLLNSIASTLPWFEVFCGLLLLTGVAVRGAALILVLMLVPFTIAVFKRALSIASAKAIAFCAVKFDCGCGAGEVLICHKLIENSLLILLALWLLFRNRSPLCARFSLFRENPAPANLQPNLTT